MYFYCSVPLERLGSVVDFPKQIHTKFNFLPWIQYLWDHIIASLGLLFPHLLHEVQDSLGLPAVEQLKGRNWVALARSSDSCTRGIPSSFRGSLGPETTTPGFSYARGAPLSSWGRISSMTSQGHPPELSASSTPMKTAYCWTGDWGLDCSREAAAPLRVPQSLPNLSQG